MRIWLVIGALVLVACGSGPATTAAAGPDLPLVDGASIHTVVTASDRPVVLNIWASWCIPCRSEAPLLDAAHEGFGDSVTFIGVAVDDSQSGAKAFLAEFGITFDNYFDPRRSVPAELGGVGVPITYFLDAAGEVVHRHHGVIDERTLAINVDELLAR